MKFRSILASLMIAASLQLSTWAGPANLAPNFTLPVHGSTTESLSLYDFAGHIILLEFFSAT